MSSGPVRAAWLRIEEIIDPLFPGGTNPMRNLGALACLMFAVTAAQRHISVCILRYLR
jgi:hypothetical protein